MAENCYYNCCCWHFYDFLRSEGTTGSSSHQWIFVNNIDPDAFEPPLVEGDIAVRTDGKNADPCTSRGCLWNKWTDGKVYIPYYIANHYGKYKWLKSHRNRRIHNLNPNESWPPFWTCPVVLVDSRERAIIVRGLESFSGFSCIRFRPYQNGDNEWLSIESRDG